MNPDKSNYVEKRKVHRNYGTSGSGLTAQEVVDRVLKDITPTVNEVVRNGVQSNGLDLSSEAAKRDFVQNLILDLRPVVFQVVTGVLKQTSTTYLDPTELTDLIIIQLTSVIEAGVTQQLAELTSNIENDVVAQIIKLLKPTVISVVQATVSSSEVSCLFTFLKNDSCLFAIFEK